MKSFFFYAIALGFVLISMNAISDDNDSRKVRNLVLEKEIVSLESLLPDIRKHGDLKLLEIELEEKDDRLVYEVELLDKDGRVYEILYDARTGQELEFDVD
jgi:uncharacterized membrane protein YkoI